MKANLIDIMLNASSDWNTEEASMLYSHTKRLQVSLADNLNELDNAAPANLQNLLASADAFIEANSSSLETLIMSYVNPNNAN